MSEPKHLTIARKYLGQKEVAGIGSNAWILNLWLSVGWIWSTVSRKDDSVLPWCGAFINYVFKEAGLPSVKGWWSAKSWLNFGVSCKACLGAIGVIDRKGGGHVGILVGKDNIGNILMIGGNQNDSVKISAFKPSVFVGFRKPEGMAFVHLPILSAELSESEF